ncbi:MAG: hypothetical protein CMP59_08675 [Flavobacteriales bacterium]|nr:hypothetical protein [Flavobacteriales bacterium]|tara:strand:- start:3972 stop:4427 length:456 start_codon:yes stop_codon:yes gene_type:complete
MQPELILTSDYKEALLLYDFEFFLEKDIEQNDYSESEVQLIYSTYQSVTNKLKSDRIKNPKQHHYYLEGQVRLMFEDKGFLAGFLGLKGGGYSRSTIDFKAMGDNWAYFDMWQKYERRKFRRKTAWDYITKIGAVLAILLTILTIWKSIIG